MTVDVGETGSRNGRVAVAAMFLVNGFIIGSWAPQIPLLLTRLSITESVVGLLILGFGLGALIAMPCAGWLISRHGSRITTTVFALGAAFSLLAVVAAPGLTATAAAMIGFGAVLGGMDVAMNANAVAVEKQLRRAIMSSSHGFWSLGGFIGGGAGGLVIEAYGAVAHAALVSAASLLLVLVAMRHLVNGDAPQGGERLPFVLPRNRTVYVVGIIALLSMIPEGAVLDWAALYLRQELSATIATAGFAFAAFSGTMALMRFVGDGVRNRFGAVATLRVSSLVAAAGLLVAGLAPGPWLAIAAFAAAGLGIANMVPIAFSAAGNQPGTHAGAGMSIVTTMGYSGILVAPSAIGFIGERTGFQPVYIAVAALLALVSLMAGAASAADAARTISPGRAG